MDFFTLVATISLSVQIVVLILLAFGYSLRGKKKYRQHGIVMLTAVVLHILTILTVMVPSFASFFGAPNIVFDLLVIASLVHGLLGSIAVVLGIWLVASWRLQKDMQMCFAKKKIMRGTLTLWVIAILLGIFMYISLYATQLLG